MKEGRRILDVFEPGMPGKTIKWRPSHPIVDGFLEWVEMNTDPKMSARPCGCDPGANHKCEWHRTQEGSLDLNAKNDVAIGAGFVTKDSGERQQFASGMKRDTTAGKLLWHLVRFGPMLLRWVQLLTRGAVKYDENNWMKANGDAERRRFIQSAERHFAVWSTYRLTGWNIEDPNNPTMAPLTEDHAAAVFFNINGTEYVEDVMLARAKSDVAKAYHADEGSLMTGAGVALDGATWGDRVREQEMDAAIGKAVAETEARKRAEALKAQQEKAKEAYRPGGPGGQVCCGQPEGCISAGCVVRQQHDEVKRFHAADAPYVAALKRPEEPVRIKKEMARIVQSGIPGSEMKAAGFLGEAFEDESSWRVTVERERY